MVNLGVSYFLPMSRKVTKKGGRTFRSLLPLFTGYVFFCGDEQQRLDVLKTNRVANLIEVPDQEGFVADIVPIETVLKEGKSLVCHEFIRAGQRCKVISGALMGTEAIVEKTSSATRLILQIDILGQATSVEIDGDMIEIIE